MGLRTRSESSEGGKIYTLAQSGTSKSHKPQQTTILTGKGSDLLDTDFLLKKAKRKIISDPTILSLIDIAKEQGDERKIQSYWNTYHCQRRLISSDDRLYGKYCKNRFCTTCCANRKADLINTYYHIIREWSDPHFVTLTFRAPNAKNLKKYMDGLIKLLKRIQNKLKKQHQRGKLKEKPMWIRSLECNFNPNKKTYNPHFHLIVPTESLAKLLIDEWLMACRPKDKRIYKHKNASPKAQHYKRVEDLDHQLVEVIKYGAKIFTEPKETTNSKKVDATIYAKALDTIYSAMKGRRLFSHFGFNLPKKEVEYHIREVSNKVDWEYDSSHRDWIDKKSGELLTKYIPDEQLSKLLSNIDSIIY